MALALYRDKQIGIKLESAAGTQEVLTASDYGLDLTEADFKANAEAIDSQAFRGSISSTPSRIGKIEGTGNIGGEFKNSGILNTRAKIFDLLQICRMEEAEVLTLVTSSPTDAATLKRGISVVTGGTSTAKGLVIGYEAPKLFVKVLSGTFVTESVSEVGETFTATIDSIGDQEGFVFQPATGMASEKTATVFLNDGGIKKPIYGGAATIAISLSTDAEPRWTATVQGVADSEEWGKTATDVSGIVFEDHLPGIVNEANLLIADTVAPIANSVTTDLGNTLYTIKDLNSPTWLKYAVVTERNAVGSIVALAIDPASHSVYQALFAGQLGAMEFKIGSGAGNAIEVFCPASQYIDITDGDDQGFLSQTINMKLTGTDNEMFVWFR
jgi:hypothetical protein